MTSNALAIPLIDLASTPLPGSGTVIDGNDEEEEEEEYEDDNDLAKRGCPRSSKITKGAFVDVIPRSVASGENQCAGLNV
jgi:hypothetical protein